MPDFKSTLVKLYLVLGTSVCLFFGTGAIAGWKMPDMDFGASGFGHGRSTGGFWGIGK